MIRERLCAALLCAGLLVTRAAAGDAPPTDSVAAATRNGNPAHAAELYTQALQSQGVAGIERAHILVNRGLVYEQMGRNEDAIADFTQAISLKILPPQDTARVLVDRGVTFDEMDKRDSALADYSAALAAVPDFPAALNDRANAYRRRGDLEDAKRDYQASLKGNPTPEYPLYGLGQIAEAQGDNAAALDFYRKAAAANPKFDLVAERIAVLKKTALETPVPPTPAPAPRIAGNGSGPKAAVQIQLGAYHDKAAANDAWKHLLSKTGALLHSLKPDIVKVDVAGKNALYRLRAGPLPAAKDADALCQSMKAHGFACTIVGT